MFRYYNKLWKILKHWKRSNIGCYLQKTSKTTDRNLPFARNELGKKSRILQQIMKNSQVFEDWLIKIYLLKKYKYIHPRKAKLKKN